MKTESEIENILRQAPAPKPTPQLAAALKSAVKLPGSADGADLELSVPLWRRWFPALAYAILILGCVIVLAVQSNQQQELLRQNEQLRAEIAVAEEAVRERDRQLAQTAGAGRELEQLKRDAAEADRLAERLAELQSQIAALNAQAKDLESQLAVVPASQVPIEPFDFFDATDSALSKARARAASISCVNNLKQIGLSFRIFANDNEGWFPPNFNTLTNELSLAKTLCCPADRANNDLANTLFTAGGAGWAGWPLNGGSYEMLGANLRVDAPGMPERVIARCRIHGHVAMGDGAVFQSRKPEGVSP